MFCLCNWQKNMANAYCDEGQDTGFITDHVEVFTGLSIGVKN